MVLEGRKQAKIIQKTSTEWVIRPRCIFQMITAYVHDKPDQGSPIIMLFSVMCGGWCANLFLIWRLRGWSQELIASWSGTPEPVILEGIKVPPPCWAALSAGGCTRFELTHPGKAIKNRCPPAHTYVLELCTNSRPGSWTASEKKGKTRDLSEENNSLYLWDANLLAHYWLVMWPWHGRSSGTAPGLMSRKGANR